MKLGVLATHPEGGHYREVFRSNTPVQTGDGRQRSALTHIYFELRPGERSGFHRVSSDEIWNLYRGAGVRVAQWDGQSADVEIIELTAESDNYCHIVPAGYWQAAEPIGDAVLVGCSVGPGFDFADFEMLDPTSRAADAIRNAEIDATRFIPS